MSCFSLCKSGHLCFVLYHRAEVYYGYVMFLQAKYVQQHSYAVEVGLEQENYEVAENVGDSDLALLVCANTTSDVLVGFTVTVSAQSGTALGKLYIVYWSSSISLMPSFK